MYPYNNLIGNKDLISEILSDFQSNEKLGFIYFLKYIMIL